MHRIIQLGPLNEFIETYINQHYEVIRLWEAASPESLIREKGAECEAILTSAFFDFPHQFLDQLPKLKIVCNHGVGYDRIDTEQLKKRGIHLTNTPNVLNDAVADWAVAMLLGAARGLVQADQYVRQGQWVKMNSFPLQSDVAHKKVGIVGLGSIGQVIAKRLQGFDVEIRYHNRKAREVAYVFEPNLKALAQWADFLIVITVGGDQTRHLINQEIIEALGPKGILVNVARGSVVDQEALIKALQDKRLGFAALDVFESEPNIPDELKQLPNTLLAPHIGSATHECRQAMAQLLLDNLDAYFKGEPLLTPVV